MLSRFLVALFSLAIASGFAQPVPKLNSLSRDWIQRGTQEQITLSGENLGAVTNVIISGAPGVVGAITQPAAAAIHVESSEGGITSVIRRDGKSIQVTLTAEQTAALSDRELRAVSAEGVSNPLTLRVSPLKEVASADNVSRQTAQRLELPLSVSGTIQSSAETDYFLFGAKKGEHVIAEVYAYRIGSKLDSSLAILDKAGKELARNEDALGLDSLLDFTVPEDGEYLLELRDFRYQGGGDFSYRMIVGVLPHVSSAFPYGGKRGETVDFTLNGSNLDANKLTLNLAPDAPLGRQEIRASSRYGLSNPFPLAVSDLPQISEREPNSALDQADLIKVPTAINGRIGKKGDYDAFRFGASKDQRIVFDVAASRFGSPLDALLILTDATGTVLQRNDDAVGEDARIDYTFKEAGTYHIILEDLLGRGGNDFGYRLTADSPQPNFSVTLVRDTPRLRRSGRVPLRCEVNRMNGFDDAVTVTCEQLPSGVYAEPLVLPSGTGAGFLILTATAEAPLGTFPLKVIARAKLNGKSTNRSAEVLNGERPVKDAFFTVLEAAPFSVSAATLMANIEQNQSATVAVIVDRKNGFDGEIKVSAEGFSAGREPITKSFDVQTLTLKPGESRGALSLKAKLDSEIGTRPIVLRAEGDAGVVDYSSLVPLATSQVPFVLSTSLKKLIVTALPPGSGSSAGEAVFSAKAERRAGFAGEIELKLAGVPEGVIASISNIVGNANESVIKLVATEKAAVATNIQLTLTGVGQHNDRNYKMQAPPITLVINAPESEQKTEPKLANVK